MNWDGQTASQQLKVEYDYRMESWVTDEDLAARRDAFKAIEGIEVDLDLAVQSLAQANENIERLQALMKRDLAPGCAHHHSGKRIWATCSCTDGRFSKPVTGAPARTISGSRMCAPLPWEAHVGNIFRARTAAFQTCNGGARAHHSGSRMCAPPTWEAHVGNIVRARTAAFPNL